MYLRKIPMFLTLISSLLFIGCGTSTEGPEKENIQPSNSQEVETINKRTYYDMTGEKLKESYFVLKDSQFVKHGPYVMYHEEGAVSMEYHYKMGDPNGEVIDYYPDGSVYSKYAYKDGRPHGPFSWYYPDGKVKLTGFYLEGQYADTLKEYAHDGTLLRATTDYSTMGKSQAVGQ